MFCKVPYFAVLYIVAIVAGHSSKPQSVYSTETDTLSRAYHSLSETGLTIMVIEIIQNSFYKSVICFQTSFLFLSFPTITCT